MTLRRATIVLRWALLAASALFVAGVFPFASHGADAAVQNTGPLAVSVTPSRNLSDGQTVAVHVQAGSGVVIYSITAHTCMPDKVTGEFSFGFSGNFCPNVPIGHGDLEKAATFPGAQSADLQYKVGVGSVNWTNERGFPFSLTCDATHACDLVLKIEIPNNTVYARAPLCYGTDCPVVVEDPGTGSGGGSGGSAGSTAAAAGSATGNSQSGASGGTGSPTTPTQAHATTGTGSSTGSVGSGGTSRSSDSSAATPGATNASVTTSTGDSTRGTRVFVGGFAGALGGAHIVSVLSRARRRAGVWFA